MRKLNIIISLIRIYFLDKLSFNSRKFKRVKLRNSVESVVIYVAPSNFNSQVEGVLVPDKLHDIVHGLESAGIGCSYLLRYFMDSKERLPLWQIFKSSSILQVRIQFFKFFLLWFSSLKSILKNMHSDTKDPKGQKLLATFLNHALADSLRELNPSFVLSIGVTQDFLAVCESLEIPVVEVMHGVFFREEIAKDWGDPAKRKPSLVFTWHDHYTEILKEYGVKAVTLGYPKVEFGSLEKKESSQIRILTTLGYNHLDFRNPMSILNEELFDQLVRLNFPGSELIFRVHPVVASDKQLCRKLIVLLKEKFDNPVVHLPWQKTLEESFYDVDIHVTSSSASYFEASMFGIPTIFLEDINSLQIPIDFLANGFVIQGGSLDFSKLLGLRDIALVTPVRNMRIEDFFSGLKELN